MKERGMIFNGDMVRAILEGGKTQTRRPVKFPFYDKNMGCLLSGNELAGEISAGNYLNSPIGKPGDRIWVRETWGDVNLEGIPAVAYRSDGDVYSLMGDESFLDRDGAFNYDDPRVAKYYFAAWYSDLVSGVEGNWRPSIHMPRWASRITLEITGVRVERLHSITLGDICKEIGCGLYDFRPATYGFQAWKDLWRSIYGDEGWKANPWVWVIEFKVVPNVHGNPA